MSSLISSESRNQSLFRFFSIGVAASNKERTSQYLEVTPLEQLPMLDGELTHKTSDYEARGSSSTGVAYEENLTTTATLSAKWLPLGQSHRQTPPDVRRGEQVIIYQYADQDAYFWDTLGNDVALRKLETVVYAWSDTEDESVEEANPENSYTLTISTHDGHITLQTAKANKEPFAYTWKFDTKNGNVLLQDDIGNLFKLDSKPKHLLLKNADGSLFELIGKVSNWKAADSINVETKSWNLKTSTMNSKGEQTHQGNTQHNGNMGIAGGLSGAAGAGSDGSAEFQGGIRTRKDVVAGGKSLMHHTHPVQGSRTGEPY